MLITIFIPTYNRAHTLNRTLASIACQLYQDIEVIIIDDGSTDGTADIVTAWASKQPFPVIYRKQLNQGKFAAHNHALRLASGELFLLLDSDDQLAPNIISYIAEFWGLLSNEEKQTLAGIEGLCVDIDGDVVGSKYPIDFMISNYFEIRYFYHVGGDKKLALRTDLVRTYPYPQFSGETFIRDDILWKRISESYDTIYVNQPFQIVEYQKDGLSQTVFHNRVKNPQGFRYYYHEELGRESKLIPLAVRLDAYHRFIRYSLHCKITLKQQWREVPSILVWLLMFPKGFFKYYSDRFRLKFLT